MLGEGRIGKGSVVARARSGEVARLRVAPVRVVECEYKEPDL